MELEEAAVLQVIRHEKPRVTQRVERDVVIRPAAAAEIQRAVAPLPERDARRPDADVGYLAQRGRARDGRADPAHRQAQAERLREPRRPRAGGGDGHARAYRAAIGRHFTHRPVRCADRFYGAALHDPYAARRRGARECLRRLARLRMAVALRIHAAQPFAVQVGDKLLQLGRRQHVRVEAVLACGLAPRLEQRHAVGRGGEREIAALHPFDVRAELALEARPDAVRLDHQRQLERIPALLPDEAPVASRLRAADFVLLDQHRRCAALREVIRGRASDDAAADDHDVGLAR